MSLKSRGLFRWLAKLTATEMRFVLTHPTRQILLTQLTKNAFYTQAAGESMRPLFTNSGLFVNGLHEPAWTQFLVQGPRCLARRSIFIAKWKMSQIIFTVRVRVKMSWSHTNGEQPRDSYITQKHTDSHSRFCESLLLQHKKYLWRHFKMTASLPPPPLPPDKGDCENL